MENTQDDEIQSEILSNEDSSNTPVEPSRDTVTPVFPPRQKPSGKPCPSAPQLDEIDSEPVRDTVRQLVPPGKKTSGKRSNPSDPQVDEAFKAIKALTENRPKRDSFDVYGEHVANKLRTYNAFTRANVEHKINCLLHEADMQTLYQSQGQFNERTTSLPPLIASTASSSSYSYLPPLTVSTASSSSYSSSVLSPYASESIQHAEPQEHNIIAPLVSQNQEGCNYTDL